MPIAPDVYKKIVTAKVYIDENFAKNLDLEHIAREACLSRFHFHRLFTRIYGRTPHQYLTGMRIRQARQWLADNDLSISEICSDIGFESIGSFSLLFKREIGYAPQFYRNQALLKKQKALQQPRSFIPHCFIDACRSDGPSPDNTDRSSPNSNNQ